MPDNGEGNGGGSHELDFASRINTMGGYYNIMDSAINAALITVMSGKSLNINRKALLYIVMFASVSEIKDFIRWFLGRIRENGYGYVTDFYRYIQTGEFKRNFIQMVKTFKYLISMKYLKRRIETPLTLCQEKEAEIFDCVKPTTLHIGDNHQVLDAILSYIDADPSRGSYMYKIIKTATTNLQDRIDKILIYNIRLTFQNIKVSFKTSVFAEYTSTKDKKVDSLDNTNRMIMTRTYKEDNDEIELFEPDIVSKRVAFTTLAHLIDNAQISELLRSHRDKFEHIAKNLGEFEPVTKFAEMSCKQKNVSPQTMIRSFDYVYSDCYENKNANFLLAELLVLLYYGNFDVRFTEDEIYLDKLSMSILYKTLRSWDMTKCEFSSTFASSHEQKIETLIKQYKQTFDAEFSKITKFDPSNVKIKPDVTFDLNVCVLADKSQSDTCKKPLPDLPQTNDDDEAGDYTEKKTNKFCCEDDQDIVPETEITRDVVKMWNTHLYDTIIKSYMDKKVNAHNVTVYTLKIGEHIEEKEVPNPDYLAYMHKKDMFESMSVGKRGVSSGKKQDSDTEKKRDDEHDDHISLAANFMMGMGLHNVPPQTIKKKIVKPVVIATKEGTVMKRLDTLYLRKQDNTRLCTILKNFSECSEIFDDLCISKKLGIMLYGVPGTGKSSTIVAIATYLNYDIYYISLNGVNKNSQLKMLFDHVAKNCSKRGLMVFEDIDAQTDVVHKRTTMIRTETDGEQIIKIKTESLDEASLSVYGADNKKNDDLDLSFFLNNLDGTLSQQDMAYVMTTNHLEKLDPALYRKGRIHAMIHLKKCDRFQISCIFAKIFKKSIDEDVLEKIPENIYTPAEVIQHFLENIHNIDMTDQQIVNGLDETKNEFAEKNALLEQNIKQGIVQGILPMGIKSCSPSDSQDQTSKTDDPVTEKPESMENNDAMNDSR